MKKQREKFLRLCCRLVWAGVLLLWAAVTITAFAFHHHHPEECDCAKHDCPFLLVVFNIPMLLVSVLSPLLPKPVTPAFCNEPGISPPTPLLNITVRGPPLFFTA